MKKVYNVEGKLEYESAATLPSYPIQCAYCGCTVAPSQGFSAMCHYERVFIYKCPSCTNPIIYNEHTGETFPGPLFGREIKGLPDNIRTLYDECRVDYSNKCYTSSQMIARTLLMHIAVEQGAQEGETFAKYIDFLDKNGFIPPNGRKWVDFIRQSGNVANHQIIIKDKKETEKVISFLSALLLFIYELPTEMDEGE